MDAFADVPRVFDVPSLAPRRITVVFPTSSFARSRVVLSSLSKNILFAKFPTIEFAVDAFPSCSARALTLVIPTVAQKFDSRMVFQICA
jgi:hypothetical protein